MRPGFYFLVAAQFFTSLADSALLIAAIALLIELQAASWMTPLLKLFFNAAYVLLAVFSGVFADSMPKGRVMFISNLLKTGGCLIMLSGSHPLLSYAIVGIGAASYSPAKFGILTEILPAEKLVAANGWVEGSGVVSIILGTVLGGILIRPHTLNLMLGFDLPLADMGIDTPAEAAILAITGIYLLAALCNLGIPNSGVHYFGHGIRPGILVKDFTHSCCLLWKDKQGRISLTVTTLFWGTGAALQFIVLKWAAQALDMPLGKAAMLQGTVAGGVAVGAAAAARYVPLERSFNVLPLGVGMGLLVMLMTAVTHVWPAVLLLILIGAMSGYFVVPMNAILQHRGQALMNAGQSIAVQNFSENLSVLIMLAVYAVLIWLNLPINVVIILFGGLIVLVMWRVVLADSRSRRVLAPLKLMRDKRRTPAGPLRVVDGRKMRSKGGLPESREQ